MVSKAFLAGGQKRKTAIATELAAGERGIAATSSGRQVLKACRIESFRRNPDGWAASWATTSAREGVLSEVLQAAGVGSADPKERGSGRRKL